MGNLGDALKSALIAALVTFGLAFPIVALRTDTNMSNQLVLNQRWGLALTLAGVVFAVRFVIALLYPAGFVRRVATGLALTLPNPAALAAWLAVATALGARSTAASVAMAAGVGLGSAVYFAGLARVAARSARSLRRPRWLDRGAALVIGAMGVVALVRGLWL